MFVKSRNGVIFLNCYPHLDFSFKPDEIIYEGWTVTYAAIQIAFALGFKRVALVGADHSYSQTGMPNELQTSNGPDSNHFDPNYFGKGTEWQLADLAGSEMAYKMARDVFEKNGKKIFNCTDGGKLEIFERMSLSEFLKNK